MKKAVLLILAGALALGMCACKKKETEPSVSFSVKSKETTETTSDPGIYPVKMVCYYTKDSDDAAAFDNEDNPYITEYYDEQGRVTTREEYAMRNGQLRFLTTNYKYNDDGSLKSYITYWSNSAIEKEVEYTYDGQGKLLEVNDGYEIVKYIYDDQGRLSEKQLSVEFGGEQDLLVVKKYEYSTDGFMVRELTKQIKGEPYNDYFEDEIFWDDAVREYTYKDGVLVREVFSGQIPNGGEEDYFNKEEVIEYEYGSKGNVLKAHKTVTDTFHEDGKTNVVTSVIILNYDEDGRLVSNRYSSDGEKNELIYKYYYD